MEEMIIHKHATFWTKGNGVLFGKIRNFNSQHQLDSRTAQLYLDTIADLSKGTPMPFLIDLRDVKGTFSSEAGLLLAKSFNNLSHIIYEVYVVNSLSISLLVQSYKRIYHTKTPFIICNDMEEAQEHCLEYKTRKLQK